MIHILSVFDKNYLTRALALYRSARAPLPEAQFWFLCLDRESQELFKKLSLPNLATRHVEELDDAELMATRSGRTAGEFAFTSKSAWLDHLSKNGSFSEGDRVIFADADVLFYPAAQNIFQNLPAFSIAVTPHDFPPEERHREALFGRFNAGMVCFTYDANSRLCMQDWRKDTIAWCYARSEDGKFADQMYLDSWPKRYKGVLVVSEPGINLGPWNAPKHALAWNHSRFTVDGKPLFAYHFHGFKAYKTARGAAKPIVIGTPKAYDPLYRHYARALSEASNAALSIDQQWTYGFAPRPSLLRTIKRTIVRFIKG